MALSSHIASTSVPWKYHVFMSFRGIDTRMRFVVHLFDRLQFRSILTFKDDREIEKGTAIPQKLLRAIEESQVAIVILSENFASSICCLDEVSKIVECMEPNTILPVFYDVNPSHVRNQTGAFLEAFNEHENNFDIAKVQRWRDALTTVANISGWTLKDKCENLTIKQIVEEVCDKVYRTFTLVGPPTKLVGINSRLNRMESLLHLEARDVRFVGIWGTGSTGKTTIARLVYEKVHRRFDFSYFLANVRRVCTTDGMVQLQKQILSPFLKHKVGEIWDVHSGINLTKYFFRNKKVLLVLDDVDQLNQLETLAGNKDWFGLVSRVIITARKQSLLVDHGIEEPYELLGLQDKEAIHRTCTGDAQKTDGTEGDSLAQREPEDDVHSYQIGSLPLRNLNRIARTRVG